MSTSVSPSTPNSTHKTSLMAPKAVKATTDSSRNGSASSATTANGSVSGASATSRSTTPTTASSASSSSTGSKHPTGPRRFRGDVPAFNPSSNLGSPHIYHPEMRHYHPQSHGLQPMYPNQNPQFYSQHPQLMFNGQMMQPFYPMAMGYPDYSMYQPYQYYMANPYQAQVLVPYVHNMNGFTNNNATNNGNGTNNNRKKHFRNNHYANHNSNNHNVHPTYVNGKHLPNPQHHSNMSSYPSNSSNNAAASPNHLAAAHGSYTSPVVSPKILSQMTHNKDSSSSNHTLEPLHTEAVAPSNTNLQQSTRSATPKNPTDCPVSKAAPASEKSATTNDNDTSNSAQNKRSASANETSPDSRSKMSSIKDGLANQVPKYPVLFNITLKEFEQERKASVKSYNSLMEKKSLHQKLKSMSSSKSLYIDTDIQLKVINLNTGSEIQKYVCDQSVLKDSKPASVKASPSIAKSPMNWASLLLNSVKKVPVLKNKSSVSKTQVSERQTIPTENKVLSLTSLNQVSGPQPLGLIAIMMLYDPKFDINTVKGFNLKPRGLTNSGNICYMNAVLQCLMFYPTFNRIFSFIGEKSIGSLGGASPTPLIDATISFLRDFADIPVAAKGGSVVNSDGIVVGKPLSPEKLYMRLIESPRFQHLTWGQQEDAEEFLGYFLDGIHEEFVAAEATISPEKFEQLSVAYGGQLDTVLAAELKGRMKIASRLVRRTSKTEEARRVEDEKDTSDKEWSEVGSGSQISKKRVSEIEPSPITRLFGGKFRSVLTVPKAKEGNSITVDPFRCILVDISQENATTIEDALWQFNEIEKIPYKTEAGVEVVAKKQTFIDELPEILILQLKRFSYRNEEQAESDAQPQTTSSNHGVGTIEKVMKTVQYRLDLSVAPEILSPGIRGAAMRNYLLIGVIYHHGRNAEGGHYTCDVLRQDQEWLRIDDTAVESIPASKVTEKPEARDKSAYILMYQRKGVKDTSKRWWC